MSRRYRFAVQCGEYKNVLLTEVEVEGDVANTGKGHRHRLKERFLAGVGCALSDETLLELLLTYAIPRTDVQPLAAQLLVTFGSLHGVLNATHAALCAIDGIGEHAAVLLQLMGAMGAARTSSAPVADDDASLFPGVPVPTSLPAAIERVDTGREAVTYINDAATVGESSAWERGRLARPGSNVGTGETPALPGEARTGEQRSERHALPGGTGTGEQRSERHALPEGGGLSERHQSKNPHAAAEDGAVTEDPLDAGETGRGETMWRATGVYSASNASKAGLLPETELALRAYGRLHDLDAARRALLDGGLPQRSRTTRAVIVRTIVDRLVAWHPPAWVCDDLVAAAQDGSAADLQLLVLLHTVRQDTLLYDIVQRVVWPLWREGTVAISRVDVQRYLDGAVPRHLEIDRWSIATREKLAGNLLTILRDGGVLRGAATKHIVEPVVSTTAAAHLARLLEAEDVPQDDVAEQPDCPIWLLGPTRARTLLAYARREAVQSL